MFSLIILAVGLALAYIYLKLKDHYNYWKKKNVPFAKSYPIFGNMTGLALRQKSFSHILQDAYNEFPNSRYYGFFMFLRPSLMVRDMELIKKITVKEFDTFANHPELMPDNMDDFFSKSLISLNGKEWHFMRGVLSPVFTSRKIKAMFHLMTECAQQFVDHFQDAEGTVKIEFREVIMGVSNDVIASTALGIQCDSLKNKDNKFYTTGKKIFNFDGIRTLKFFMGSISPTLTRILNLKFFDDDVKDFLCDVVKETIEHREKTGVVRPDLIHLLMEAQKGKLQYDEDLNFKNEGFAVVEESDIGKRMKERPKLSDVDIAAQVLVFFFGGFETVAAALSQTVYELTVNPDVQQRLFEEIVETLESNNGVITYEGLVGMKYLDMVVSESLRLWPPGVLVGRKSTKPYTIEKEGDEEQSLHLEQGSTVYIPVYALHRDPNYYPNPDKFDPERFSDENKKNIPQFAYMPFGAGPRTCIASRFALLEIKVVVFHLVKNYELVVVEETQIPFKLSTRNINITTDKGYWMGLKRRTKHN